MSTTDKVKVILMRLFASYPNVQASDLSIAAYLDILKDIPVAELDVAVKQSIIDSPTFIPPAPTIYVTWQRMKIPEQRSGAEAWGSVVRALREVGHTATPKFNDPLTAQVVKSLGWQYLCQSEDQMADRAHFMRMYEELRQREERDRRLLPEARRLTEHYATLNELTAGVVNARQIMQKERET